MITQELILKSQFNISVQLSALSVSVVKNISSFYLVAFLLLSNFTLAQDSSAPQTIHIQRVAQVSTIPKLDTSIISSSAWKRDTITCIPMVSKATGGLWTTKLKREAILNAGAVTLQCQFKCTVVSYKMKFARRISQYQMKKVLKVDGKKTYLVANNAQFTEEMMSVIEAVPRGERILIYSIKAKKKDGEIKRLKRILIKVV